MQPTSQFMLPITRSMLSAFLIIVPIFVGQAVPRLHDLSQSGQRPTNEADRLRTENERDLETRIWNLRSLSERPRQPEKKRPNPKQALAEMQKDFVRLQVVNKDLLKVALSNGTLEPRFVLKSVTEIKERAERLNRNLALPEPDRTAAPSRPALPAGPDHLKRSVMRLGTLIFSFVDNPFFKEINVVDTLQTARARRDLEDIIELSSEIKKSSEHED